MTRQQDGLVIVLIAEIKSTQSGEQIRHGQGGMFGKPKLDRTR
jgi:hypothetical protein